MFWRKHSFGGRCESRWPNERPGYRETPVLQNNAIGLGHSMSFFELAVVAATAPDRKRARARNRVSRMRTLRPFDVLAAKSVS